MANAKFDINLDTGDFIVTSIEYVLEGGIMEQKIPFKPKETHSFRSTWSFNNDLLDFEMNGEKGFHILTNEDHIYHKLATQAKSSHLSIMRYERT